jgi:hypothetical protein
MKKIFFVLVAVHFLSMTVVAQFNATTVSLKDRRTLTGFVKGLKNGNNPQELILYPQKDDKDPQPVPAETIKEVTIEGEGTFIVAKVKKYTNELDFDKLTRISDFENKENYVVQTLFLKVLLRGDKLNLYAYKDASRKHYFIQKPNSEIETLRYLRSLDPVTKSTLKDYRYYQQQLLPYVSGNKKLENRLEAVGWNDNSMIRICKDINANTTAYALYEGKTAERSVLFIGVGANMSSFSAVDANDQQSFYKNMTLNSSTLPILHLGTELNFNGNDKSGFRFQLSLSAFPFSTTGNSTFNSSGTQVNAAISVQGLNVMFGPALKYKFGKSFTLGTGANFNITSFSELKGNNMPQWAVERGVFATFGRSKPGSPVTISPYAMAEYMFTPKHGMLLLFAPQQKNVKFYEGARLKLGYASLSYIFRIPSGKN